MGQSRSKENDDLSKVTHFSKNEINVLRHNVKEKDQNNITEDVFKDSVKQYLPSVSNEDDAFLKRLYAALGGDEEKAIDFRKFVDGLSIFMKGTPDEKLQLSFRLYDVDKDGFISKDELEKVMLQLSDILSEQDENSENIQASIDCLFQDFDVDGDGKLSFEEYKLSAIKEPLIADFLEGFLERHDLSTKPKLTSRPSSVRSKSYKNNAQNRLSVRLSQSDILDYSHQHQNLTLSDSSSSQSPKNSVHLSLSPAESTGSIKALTPSSTGRPRRLSRGVSMASLDAAMTSL